MVDLVTLVLQRVRAPHDVECVLGRREAFDGFDQQLGFFNRHLGLLLKCVEVIKLYLFAHCSLNLLYEE